MFLNSKTDKIWTCKILIPFYVHFAIAFYYWNFITKHAHPAKFRKSLIMDNKPTVAFLWEK